jgi:ParB-like nuclease domain
VAQSSYYPSDATGRQQLADELTARGLKPTQAKHNLYRDKIDKVVDAMQDGSFDWNDASLQPVIFGPNSEIIDGHHRVVAAHLAGIDLKTIPGPRPQVQFVPVNYRHVFDWLDVLPEVP